MSRNSLLLGPSYIIQSPNGCNLLCFCNYVCIQIKKKFFLISICVSIHSYIHIYGYTVVWLYEYMYVVRLFLYRPIVERLYPTLFLQLCFYANQEELFLNHHLGRGGKVLVCVNIWKYGCVHICIYGNVVLWL
jgi:hypothetical protein